MESPKQSNQNPIASFEATKSDEGVIRVEMIYSNLVGEHNVPFLLADHFTKAYKLMFPDSTKD